MLDGTGQLQNQPTLVMLRRVYRMFGNALTPLVNTG
jgi:hypothetical protein